MWSILVSLIENVEFEDGVGVDLRNSDILWWMLVLEFD